MGGGVPLSGRAPARALSLLASLALVPGRAGRHDRRRRHRLRRPWRLRRPPVAGRTRFDPDLYLPPGAPAGDLPGRPPRTGTGSDSEEIVRAHALRRYGSTPTSVTAA